MRNTLRQLKRAAAMPPGELLAKVRRKLHARRVDASQRRVDATQPTFGSTSPDRPLARLVGPLEIALIEQHRGVITELVARVMAHEFDLLGSGWTHVENTHGLQVTDVNLKEAEHVAALITPEYKAIDWHVDFKSGKNRQPRSTNHRWNPRVWCRDQPQFVANGIDVKIPWELARMQHLPLLAWSYALACEASSSSIAMPLPAGHYAQEFRNQILDFIAHNPPRYGVNWNCAMDVGIRVAGWVLTLDLFLAAGATFDDAFLDVFARSVREHADHLAANLEWDETIRGNHYLADIAGLLSASAYLPADETTDSYLHFAARELVAETFRQFHNDGSNFEASTSYHRLSAEMVVYALAVLQGVSATRYDALAGDQWHPFRPGKPSAKLDFSNYQKSRIEVNKDKKEGEKEGEKGSVPFKVTFKVIPLAVIDRLARMSRFTQDILDGYGRDPQIGDNDSGRFFKMLPATMRDEHGVLFEDTRNHLHLVDAIDGFFAPTANTPDSLETHVVRSMLGGAVFERPDLPAFTDHIAYPGMGLYLFKHGRFTTIVRCGEVGQDGNGGHAHDDAMSFVLYVEGEPIIVEMGTGCYTPDADLRNKMRHVTRHNCVVVEGGLVRFADFRAGGLFQLKDKAKAILLGRSTTGVVMSHTLFGRPIRRELRCWNNELQIVDQLQGVPERYAALHFAPGGTVEFESETARRLTLGSIRLRLQCEIDKPIVQEVAMISEGYGLAMQEVTRLVLPLTGQSECTYSISVVEETQ